MAVKERLARLATVRVRLTVLAVLVVGAGVSAGGIMVLALVRSDLMATARDAEQVDEGVEATAYALLLAVPGLLAGIAAIAWVLVGRALRPVEIIRARVAEITASELDNRVPEPSTQDELGRLAKTMNEMLERLQVAHERQRRFVGDAAHELRSPLAAMTTRIEVGLAHPDGTDWVELGRQVHHQAARLTALAEALLILARTDSGVDDREWVDLDEVVLAEAESVRARARVSVELSPFSAVRVRGRPHDLRAVVRNLLDNAERHARRSIVVGLRRADGHAELVVSDDGDGIPAADRERVFERFLRLHDARDRDRGGAGLGLAIVRDVATGHGGRAWVADTDHGAELHVRLPLTGP
ncbi:ATP-binding protein [Amycolatopsis sp. NPDC049868]|uniref:ATP-binding protein n=1 Tax=Amycolatopsis sp. NPDC049868 TaxID=3363934 RepID=UPI00379AE131